MTESLQITVLIIQLIAFSILAITWGWDLLDSYRYHRNKRDAGMQHSHPHTRNSVDLEAYHREGRKAYVELKKQQHDAQMKFYEDALERRDRK